jgi:hypothetical protein
MKKFILGLILVLSVSVAKAQTYGFSGACGTTQYGTTCLATNVTDWQGNLYEQLALQFGSDGAVTLWQYDPQGQNGFSLNVTEFESPAFEIGATNTGSFPGGTITWYGYQVKCGGYKGSVRYCKRFFGTITFDPTAS